MREARVTKLKSKVESRKEDCTDSDQTFEFEFFVNKMKRGEFVMPKIQEGYFNCSAIWLYFCVLAVVHSMGFSYLSSTTMAQNSFPNNGWVVIEVTVPDGLGSWKKVTAFKGGLSAIEPAWLYVAGSWGHPGATPPCSDPAHRTKLSSTYQHVHVGTNFPIYDKDGVEITKAMIEEGWKLFFTARYGANQFLSRPEPNLFYNCHSFATGTTTHWNELISTKISDDFQLAYFHHLTTCFCLEQGTIGGFVHSLKFYFYEVGPSGTGILYTEEKFRESQIFLHIWPITDQNSPPAGTTGPSWTRGVKYKPK